MPCNDVLFDASLLEITIPSHQPDDEDVQYLAVYGAAWVADLGLIERNLRTGKTRCLTARCRGACSHRRLAAVRDDGDDDNDVREHFEELFEDPEVNLDDPWVDPKTEKLRTHNCKSHKPVPTHPDKAGMDAASALFHSHSRNGTVLDLQPNVAGPRRAAFLYHRNGAHMPVTIPASGYDGGGDFILNLDDTHLFSWPLLDELWIRAASSPPSYRASWHAMVNLYIRVHSLPDELVRTVALQRKNYQRACINYIVLQDIKYPAEMLCPHCHGQKGIVLDGTDLCMKSLAMHLPSVSRKGEMRTGPMASGMVFLPTCGTFEAARLLKAYTSAPTFNIKKCRKNPGETLTDSQFERLQELLKTGDRGGKVVEGGKGQWTVVASDQQPAMRNTFAPRLQALLPLLADSTGAQDENNAPGDLRVLLQSLASGYTTNPIAPYATHDAIDRVLRSDDVLSIQVCSKGSLQMEGTVYSE
jgi:hypothetical protein